jgi:hypothetical protein
MPDLSPSLTSSSPNSSSPKDCRSIFLPAEVSLVDLRSQDGALNATSALPVGRADFDSGLFTPSFGGLLQHLKPKGGTRVFLDVAVR